MKVSDSANLVNNKGRYYGKDNAVKIQWHKDSDKREEISFLIIQIKKMLFNCYIEFDWHMYFDVS